LVSFKPQCTAPWGWHDAKTLGVYKTVFIYTKGAL